VGIQRQAQFFMEKKSLRIDWYQTSGKIFEGGLKSFEIAFSLAVLVGYSALFSTRPFDLTSSFITLILILGMIYTALGIYGHRWVESLHSKQALLLYFVVMVPLGGLISYLGMSSNWLVLLPLISQAIITLSRRQGYGLTLLIWLIALIPLFQANLPVEVIISSATQTLAAVVFVAVFTQISVNERRARQELALVNQQLREYAARAEELATVQERNRLAREIHDGLGHYLTAVNIQIKAAQSVIKNDPELAQTALNNAQTLTQEALADVRRSISALRSDHTSNRPLAETLGQLLNEASASGLDTHLSVEGTQRPLSSQVEFTLFRAVQEGLTNVRKHAQATHVTLKLEYLLDRVRLTLSDDGVGSQATESGFGLTGLQERLQIFNGLLQVQTAPGSGFTLQVEIPA
jgi:signal transduction histidine kinase